jgi:cell shape-determining protein MreD
MKPDYKKIFSVIGAIIFLIVLAGIQISFINPFFIRLNLFLILVLYLALVKDNIRAIVFAWSGGILTGINSFSIFGINSLILLIIAAVFIILGKTMFINLTTKSVLLVGVIGVLLYHSLNWALTGGGSLSYFFNIGILTELILTAVVLKILLKIRTRNV